MSKMPWHVEHICADEDKYVGVLIPGVPMQFEHVKSHSWWRCHGLAAKLWVQVKLGRL